MHCDGEESVNSDPAAWAAGTAYAAGAVAVDSAGTVLTRPGTAALPRHSRRRPARRRTTTPSSGQPRNGRAVSGRFSRPGTSGDSGGPRHNLTINLINQLSFGGAAGQDSDLAGHRRPAWRRPWAAPSASESAARPAGHDWPNEGGTGAGDTVFTPPAQADRVRSFERKSRPPAWRRWRRRLPREVR